MTTKKARFDLNRCHNEGCKGNCNKETRKIVSENDLCTITQSVKDKQPIRCVGTWAEQKIYLLYQYFGIFTQGMKNKWRELNYIEICSGPGRCIERDSRTEIDGTALAIIRHDSFQYVHNALFFDYNSKVVSVLNQRIKNLNKDNAFAFEADYNEPNKLCDILKKYCNKTYSLNLLLIDPTDCSVPFDLIRNLTETLDNLDIIINVAIGTDFNRNIPMAFEDKNRAKKYERFLGNDTFFTDSDNINYYQQKNYIKLREQFRLTFSKSMERIGYIYSDICQVENYYDIIFFAKHKTAIEFWQKAKTIKYDGQRKLFL